MLQRTPLFSLHQSLGARLVEFGGWEMPVQYSSIVGEHLAVRRAAGLFDISHMGEIVVNGPGAADFLNHTLTNDIGKLAVGQGQYSLLCNERGGVVDDLYVYRLKADEFLLIVNASRVAADWDWLQIQVDHAPARDGFRLRDVSEEFGAVAVQGPAVRQFIDAAIPGGSIGGTLAPQVTGLAKNEVATFVFQGTPVQVARTGYTGEDGFEVVAPASVVGAVWDALMVAGRPMGLQPAGLGARDTLRTEMGYPLYGHELDEDTTPIEAGLGHFVALDKGEFVGREVLAAQKERGPQKRCVAFKMTDKSAPPRPGYAICAGPDLAAVGKVVSGTQSPSLGVGIGMGYVPPEFAKPGTAIAIEIRGRRAPAVVVKKPIYQRPA
ncbi:MAG: glycine cleavage system aminomethyltransferase GcvT [Verrucomicrobia bacterium]|jgi:aminomethyltransferase|nr:glycine cleavage system aminomethyltransferase GcvT [Verrucomicrobiota bacterium]